MEEKITKLMKNLGISREEAIEVIASDAAIDKGEKLFELNAEQEKASKKARQADREADQKRAKREKKENTDKQWIINTLSSAIGVNADGNINITNKEREFEFTMAGVKYRVTLMCPRS